MPNASKQASIPSFLLKSEDIVSPAMSFHGGKSFEAIGEDFQHLERAECVVNADVLDAWFHPSPRVLKKLHEFLPLLTRTSPPIYAAGLVSAIASARGLPDSCILTGGGSSGLIFSCFPHLIDRGERAMILDPMYGEYQHVLCHVIGAQVVRFQLHKEEVFRVDTDSLIASVLENRPDLVVLVNPNSPTGQHWPRTEVIRFLNGIPDSIRVVIDETYIEYAGLVESMEKEACERPNIFVLKSMSKVYALSGLRVGYLVGKASSLQTIAQWIPPWAVSLPAQVAAVEALSDATYYEQRYSETHSFREELAFDLRRNSRLRVYPSLTNLVLVETQASAQLILEAMRDFNVFVRNCDSMGTCFGDRFLRIAVKQRMDNARIVESLTLGIERQKEEQKEK